MVAKIQIVGLFASSRQEATIELSVLVWAAGNGRWRIHNASSVSNSPTEPRKNGSNLCMAVQPTMSEQNTAPTPQKKFSRLTAPARDPGPDPNAISAISRLSAGTIKPNPNPYAPTEAIPRAGDPR